MALTQQEQNARFPQARMREDDVPLFKRLQEQMKCPGPQVLHRALLALQTERQRQAARAKRRRQR